MHQKYTNDPNHFFFPLSFFLSPVSSQQHPYSGYSYPTTTTTDPLYTGYPAGVPPNVNVKHEYPGAICGTVPSHMYGSNMVAHTTNGFYPSSRQVTSPALKPVSNHVTVMLFFF